jgi:Mismatch repair ATPase (MutS family)
MKPRLLFRDRDADARPYGLGDADPGNADAFRDFGLDALLDAMAAGDDEILAISRPVLMRSLVEVGDIEYRQAALRDCMENRGAVRELYAIIGESFAAARKSASWSSRAAPSTLLYSSIGTLGALLDGLESIRALARRSSASFSSEAFRALWALIESELDDRFFEYVRDRLGELKFDKGTLVSASLGPGCKGSDYRLRRPGGKSAVERLRDRASAFQFQIPEHDEAGARDLEELRERGINLVASALAKSQDHILDFLGLLRSELAFYLGCVNLGERLEAAGAPTCFPTAFPSSERRLSFEGLYDPCIVLGSLARAVGNDLDSSGIELLVVTGANQGGKSTFLRSLGCAQLMMQCGMFVAASRLEANVYSSIFTHYRREEDASMSSGKLDEELKRLSGVVDGLRENSALFLNESFASTNEREGSELARRIVAALLERRVEVVFVTHLYDFASSLYSRRMPNALFLRAERREDGTRSFKIAAGEPLETSYGTDLYAAVFEGQGERPRHRSSLTR